MVLSGLIKMVKLPRRDKDKDMQDKLPPETTAVVLAILIAVLRVVYDGKETTIHRILLEASLCGCLALAINHGIDAIGWNPEWKVFIGAMIGYIGSMTVRLLTIKFLHNKIEG